ncbi:GIY-YIG nuclease family protein [Pseudopedobacter saltans]|uniref:GIY-YIG nuclease family protein n=1 Tax=Pseudopedobacter saltans TaxID=151895 RepID=UPI000A0064E0
MKGFTSDYIRRVEEHNQGKSRYTKSKIPWRLIYLEACETKRSALIREKQLKRYNRKYIEWLCLQASNLIKINSEG